MTRRSSCRRGRALRRAARDVPAESLRSAGFPSLDEALNDFRCLGVGPMPAPDDVRDEPGPPGLVGGAESRTIVAVEVLVEQQVVAPPRIGLHPLDATEAWSASVSIGKEDRDQPLPEIRGDDVERRL